MITSVMKESIVSAQLQWSEALSESVVATSNFYVGMT